VYDGTGKDLGDGEFLLAQDFEGKFLVQLRGKLAQHLDINVMFNRVDITNSPAVAQVRRTRSLVKGWVCLYTPMTASPVRLPSKRETRRGACGRALNPRCEPLKAPSTEKPKLCTPHQMRPNDLEVTNCVVALNSQGGEVGVIHQMVLQTRDAFDNPLTGGGHVFRARLTTAAPFDESGSGDSPLYASVSSVLPGAPDPYYHRGLYVYASDGKQVHTRPTRVFNPHCTRADG
jgi:hypothetical protein